MSTTTTGWWFPSADSPISHFIPQGEERPLCGKDLLLKTVQRVHMQPPPGACKTCLRTLHKKPAPLLPRERLAKLLTDAGFRSADPLTNRNNGGVRYIDVQVKDLRVSRGWQRTKNVWSAELWRHEPDKRSNAALRWRWRELTSLDTMTLCAKTGVVFRELGPSSYEVIAISSAEISGIKYQKGVLFYQ